MDGADLQGLPFCWWKRFTIQIYINWLRRYWLLHGNSLGMNLWVVMWCLPSSHSFEKVEVKALVVVLRAAARVYICNPDPPSHYTTSNAIPICPFPTHLLRWCVCVCVYLLKGGGWYINNRLVKHLYNKGLPLSHYTQPPPPPSSKWLSQKPFPWLDNFCRPCDAASIIVSYVHWSKDVCFLLEKIISI